MLGPDRRQRGHSEGLWALRRAVSIAPWPHAETPFLPGHRCAGVTPECCGEMRPNK